MDNQVDFVKSDLLSGLIDKKQKQKEKRQSKKKRSRSHSASDDSDDSSMSEDRIKELEKTLTPLERERLAIKQQRESLPMFTYRDGLLAAIRDH